MHIIILINPSTKGTNLEQWDADRISLMHKKNNYVDYLAVGAAHVEK